MKLFCERRLQNRLVRAGDEYGMPLGLVDYLVNPGTVLLYSRLTALECIECGSS